MKRSLTCVVAAPLLCLAAPTSLNADLITAWTLESVVRNIGTGTTSVQSNFTPENPFQGMTSAQIGISTSVSIYNMAWSSTAGVFDITLDQQVIDTNPGFSARALGAILVEPATDLIVRFDASYTYFLPPEWLFAGLSVVAQDLNAGQTLLVRNLFDSSALGLASGTFVVDNAQALLPAGGRYSLQYSAIVDSSSGGSNAIGTGMGNVRITLSPVPEPVTGALFALAALPVLIRRRRSR